MTLFYILYITFVSCKCLFVSVTKVSVHFLICFYLLKVSKTEIFANIFADVISDGSWCRQQQHLVHSVHYCPIMRHTPCLADLHLMFDKTLTLHAFISSLRKLLIWLSLTVR